MGNVLCKLQVEFIHDLNVVSDFFALFVRCFLLLLLLIVLSSSTVSGIVSWNAAVATGFRVRSVSASTCASSFAFLSAFPFSFVGFVADGCSISVVVSIAVMWFALSFV